MGQNSRPEGAVRELRVPATLSRGGVGRLLSELEALGDGGARILVLRGATDGFCRGLELGEIRCDSDAERGTGAAPAWQVAVERFVKILKFLRNTPVVSVALVDGPALGGGVGLAAACDFVLATEAATFALPELLLGLVPATILPVLTERLGMQPAKRWALTLATWKAGEAAAAGLVDRVVPAERLDAELERLVRALLRAHPGGVARLKQLIVETQGMDQSRAIEAGQALLSSLLGQLELRGGLVAFRDYGLLPGESDA